MCHARKVSTPNSFFCKVILARCLVRMNARLVITKLMESFVSHIGHGGIEFHWTLSNINEPVWIRNEANKYMHRIDEIVCIELLEQVESVATRYTDWLGICAGMCACDRETNFSCDFDLVPTTRILDAHHESFHRHQAIKSDLRFTETIRIKLFFFAEYRE